MSHIHDLIDYTIVAYVIFKGKVLLVHHRELDKWLPLGGHIELDEDPEQALFREIEEESGLEVDVIAQKPRIEAKGTKFLYPPAFLDIHDISAAHRHVSLVYFVKAKNGEVKLAAKEHYDIRWFTREDLDKPEFNIEPQIKFYAEKAFSLCIL